MTHPCIHSRRPPALAAFTLVELLVAISIIAILIGILVPVVGSVRESGRTAACANNLRQVALAAIAYSMDHKGAWPPAHLDFLTKNLHRWHGTRPDTASLFALKGSPLIEFLQTPQIKSCPSFEPTDGGFEASAGGYGYNNHYFGSSQQEPWAIAAPPMSPSEWDQRIGNVPAKMGQIRQPANKVAFADTAIAAPNLVEYSFVEPPTTQWGPTSPSIHFRHNDKANIAWADGHVTAEFMAWTHPTNAWGADNAAMRLGYIGPKDTNAWFDRSSTP